MSFRGFSQCDNAYSNPGNIVLSEDRVCAPNQFIWEIKYSVAADKEVQFFIDWGDGNTTTVTPASNGSSGSKIDYVATVEHIYPRGGDDCNYFPTSYLVIDGQKCPNSDQSQSITVWDIDSENGGLPRIAPLEYRVCLGESANVTFDDNSIWNCVPSSGENDRINNLGRWVQWIYGTGSAENRIPGVEVNGSANTFAFNGAVEYLPGPIEASTSQSYNVFVPATSDPLDIGKEFLVQLRNWNICNPYDANLVDGDPYNPANPDGDSAYIVTTAKIIIVDKPKPDFKTRLHDASGVVKTEFCVDEAIYFQNLTKTINGAKFKYSWKIYDDEAGTTLAFSSNARHPTFAFTSKGKKRIELTVTDINSVGKCGATVTKYINIVSAADASIAVTDENDQPLQNLCLNQDENESVRVKFTDASNSFDPNNYNWLWDFYHLGETVYEMDSTKNGNGNQASFLAAFTQPGSYMAVLTVSDIAVDCFTQDTTYVHIYHQPKADFEAQEVCLGESTEFKSTASIPVVVNDDSISLYEWDFDYDGINFNPDFSSNEAASFQHKFNHPGTHSVAHQVTTAKGNCSAIMVKEVKVKPDPFVSFQADQLQGCAPLKVNFAVDTLLENQPVQVTSYIWHIKDLETGTTSDFTVNPPQDTFTAPDFTNSANNMTNHRYEVWLEATAVNSCQAISDKVTITVYPEADSEFEIMNLSGGDSNCSPRDYQFKVATATHNLNPDTYQWTIIDETDGSITAETTIEGANPDFSYTLTNEGNLSKKYRVKLLAYKSDICFHATEEVVTVNPAPSSEFTTTLIEADCQLVTFHVEAEQKGLAYAWNVDPMPLNNPDLSQDRFELVFAKKTGKSYPVDIRLQTTNLVNCKSEETLKSTMVDPQEVIDASFSVSPSVMEIPDRTVTITQNTVSSDWTYSWDFGDGTTSTTATPGMHEYETYGEYWIKVKVAGQYCYQEDSARVIIKQTLPIVAYDYSQIEGCLPLTVNFLNKSEYADEETYFWDFGDGNTSTEANPGHTYKTSGIFTVTLSASNSMGVTVKKEKDLLVDLSQGPKADFNIRLAKAYLPDQDIVFSNQSQRASLYHWDFGDGTTSAQKDPVHQYEQSGHYDITLIVQNELGCSDTLVKPVFIDPLVPEVDFSYQPPTGCRPLTVQFQNLSRYAEPGTYRWSFGAGQGVSTEENPSYTYYEPGVYTITLEAGNSIGVTATEKKEFSVEVYDNPIAAFNFRPENTFPGEDIYFVNLSTSAKYYHWDFGDGNFSTEYEPAHRYEETGTYDITLIAESENGCTDTLKKAGAVIVKAGGKLQVPNAFTPATDGPGSTDAPASSNKNDVFLPVYEGVTSFHMMIYNRWGELLFESYDKNHGWDGYYKDNLCAKDVYVYKLELTFSDGQSDTLVGDVALIR